MLRTFDELGYRQEQRFHFELGLLKLVHLRRLLPIEEVLSKFSATPAATTSRATSSATSKSSSSASSSASASIRTTPAFAPMQATPRPAPPTPPPPAVFVAPEPITAPTVAPAENVGAPSSRPLLDAKVGNRDSDPPPSASPAILPDIYAAESAAAPLQTSAPDPDHLQQAAVDALMSAKSQSTAADAIADSDFTLTTSELTIQTSISKMMLPTVINAEAEKIVRTAIQSLAAGLKITLLPGASAAKSTASKKPRAAASGSAQARALEHPIVQEAQRLFNAEIRNVIDLTPND